MPPRVFEVINMVMPKGARVTDNIMQALVLRTRYHSVEGRRRLTMAQLLHKYRATEFTKQADRVYGVLGLATDWEELGFKPNMSRSLEDTYTDITKRTIQKSVSDAEKMGGINFMSLVSFPKSITELPSWVPDFSRLKEISTLSEATTTLTTPFHASPGIKHPISNKARILLCCGIPVDEITHIGRMWEADHEGEKKLAGGLQPLTDMKNFCHRSRSIVSEDPFSSHPFRDRPQRLAEAEWRVPILDHESVSNTSCSRRATELSLKGYQELSYMVSWSSQERVYSGNPPVPLTPAEEERLSQVAPPDKILAEMRLKRDKFDECGLSVERNNYDIHLDMFRLMRPFLTGKGFVGLGPPAMEPGDLVCVLYGASFPFVLRPHGNGAERKFSLVGESYCDGIMDGEALQMGIQNQEFLLT